MNPPDGSPAEIAARIDALERICAADPQSARFVELGRLLLDADRHRRAYAVLRTGLHHQPGDLEGHLLFGEARLRLGQLALSIGEFEWVLDRDPDNIDALVLLARALEWDGRGVAARATLDRALRSAPDDPRPRQALRRLEEAARTPAGRPSNPGEDPADDTAASALAPPLADGALGDSLDGLDGLGDEEPTAALDRDALVAGGHPSGAPPSDLPFSSPWARPSIDIGEDDATASGIDDLDPRAPVSDRSTLAQGSHPIRPRPASPVADRSTVAQGSGSRRAPTEDRRTIARGSPIDDRDTVAEDPPQPPGGRATFRGVGPEDALAAPHRPLDDRGPRDRGIDPRAPLAPTGPGVAGQRLPPGVIAAGRARRASPDGSDLEHPTPGARDMPILEATRELRADDLRRGAAGLDSPLDAPLESTRELNADDLRRAGIDGPLTGVRAADPRAEQPAAHSTRAIRQPVAQPVGDPAPLPARAPDRASALHAQRRPRSTVDRAWLAVDPSAAPAHDPPTTPEGQRPQTVHLPDRGGRKASGPPARTPAAPGDDRPTIDKRRVPSEPFTPEPDPDPTGRFQKPAPREAPRGPGPGRRPPPSPGPAMPSPHPRGGAPAMPSPHPRGGPPAMPSPHPAMPSPHPAMPSPHPAMPSPHPASPPQGPPPGPLPGPTAGPTLPAPPPAVPAPGPSMAPSAPPAGPAAPPPAPGPPIQRRAPTPGAGFARPAEPRRAYPDDDGLPPIPSIEPPPARTPAPPVRSRSPWLRIALLALTVLALLVALISTLRYRRAVDALEAEVAAAADQVLDGNYGSRVDVAEALARPADDPGAMARIGHFAARLIGRPGLDRPALDRVALKARVEAERVVIFGERARRPEADAALAAARERAATRLDTAVAGALLALADGEPATAQATIDALPDALRQSADADWITARVLRETGHLSQALERARRAAERDTDHPFAPTLVGELQAEEGDLAGALDTLRVLLDKMRTGHVDTRIAFERLRIRAGKRAGEAVGNLQAVLGDRDLRLSPTQRARIHESIGLYHDEAGEVDPARAAYIRAMESDPIPRFMERLARLDLRRFALAEARDTASRAAALAPDDPRWPVLLARVDLAAGRAGEAEMRLEGLEAPGVEGRLALGRARLDLARDADGDRKTSLLRGAEDAYRAANERAGGLTDALIGADLAAHLRTGEKAALDRLRRARTERDDRPLRDRAWPFRAYGEALLGRDRARSATAQFKSAVELDPRDHRSWFGLCAASAVRLDSKAALKACREALAIDPYFDPAASLMASVAEAWRDAGAVIAALGPRLERGPMAPEDARRLARALVEQDALDRAEVVAERGTDDDASQRYVRGLIATARGKLGEARELLYAAADQLTDDAWAQTAYARLLLKQDQPAQAATYFRRAMSADDEPYAALGLAHAELDRDEAEAARLAAREAEKRASRSLSHPRVRAEALAVQARALVAGGRRRDQRRAAAMIRKADGVEPDLPETLVAAGLLAEKQRKNDRAAVRYRRLTQVAPRDPEGYYRLGRLLVDDAATRAAGRAELQRASELDPEGVWGARARQLLER